MSTSDLLNALNDPAFTRFGLPNTGTGTQVKVTGTPSSVAANTPFSLTVTIEDDANNPDKTYTGPVMLLLNGSAATATLGGTLVNDNGNIVAMTTSDNGTVTISGLKINEAGTYTINAYSVDMPGGWGTSDPITVT